MNPTQHPAGADLPQGALTDDRALFEATLGTGRVLTRAPNGDYVSMYVQGDWEVWQAALAARSGATAAAGVPSKAQTNVYIALSELPCECSPKRREEGRHLTGCHLFDLTLAIDEAFVAQTATQPASERGAT